MLKQGIARLSCSRVKCIANEVDDMIYLVTIFTMVLNQCMHFQKKNMTYVLWHLKIAVSWHLTWV